MNVDNSLKSVVPFIICKRCDGRGTIARKVKKKPGSQSRYPLQYLAVGASTLIPWLKTEDGGQASQTTLHRAVKRAELRHNKTFQMIGEADGLRVTRIR